MIGGDDETGESNGGAFGPGTPTFVPENVETPASAVKTGHRLCKLLSGYANLSKQFGVQDPVKIAQRFVDKIYVGEYPQQAAQGCLEVVG